MVALRLLGFLLWYSMLAMIPLFIIDIALLLTVAAPLRYGSPNWIKLPGAVIYALIFRRDLMGGC